MKKNLLLVAIICMGLIFSACNNTININEADNEENEASTSQASESSEESGAENENASEAESSTAGSQTSEADASSTAEADSSSKADSLSETKPDSSSESQTQSSSQAESSSQPETSNERNVSIDFLRRDYNLGGTSNAVEVPIFTLKSGESEVVNRINEYIENTVEIYTLDIEEENTRMFDGNGGVSIMTYPFTSEKYMQVVVRSHLYARMGSSGVISSVTYDIENNRYITLNDAYTLSGTSEKEIIDYTNSLLQPSGSELGQYTSVHGFMINEEGAEEYIEFFVSATVFAEPVEMQFLYSYIPHDPASGEPILTQLDTAMLFPYGEYDELSEPLEADNYFLKRANSAVNNFISYENLSGYAYSAVGDVLIQGNMCIEILATPDNAADEEMRFAIDIWDNLYKYVDVSGGEDIPKYHWNNYYPQ